MNIAYPFDIDGRKRTAQATDQEHIRQLIEQLLFTTPGERVNRYDFGTNLRQLAFAPNSSELAAATEFMIQGALQQWLGDLIVVEAVEVNSEDSTLTVAVRYVIRANEERALSEYSYEV